MDILRQRPKRGVGAKEMKLSDEESLVEQTRSL